MKLVVSHETVETRIEDWEEVEREIEEAEERAEKNREKRWREALEYLRSRK